MRQRQIADVVDRAAEVGGIAGESALRQRHSAEVVGNRATVPDGGIAGESALRQRQRAVVDVNRAAVVSTASR